MKESAVLKDCLRYLITVRGLLAWRANQIPVPLPGGKGFRKFAGRRGVSDILAILPAGRDPLGEEMPPGRMLAVETKSDTGRLRPDQAVFLDAVNRSGGLGLVVRSVGELIDGLQAEGY